LGTGSPKLQLLHSCVPKLQLGNKKQKICTNTTSGYGSDGSMLLFRRFRAGRREKRSRVQGAS
jgi:hypothetical protein